ncbi:uncharacterized protein LOC143151443 [Ptiloglossa arizonensis]|uniref:uncharacterized protein LOC143151443 n=1 Tax=Ptiloglossa arizonensis TaxID=3350558 RepID=UPI003F9FCA60
MAYECGVAEMRGLVRRRGAIKAKLTLFERFLESYEQTGDTDIATVQHRVAQLEKEFEPFEKIQGGLEMVCSDDEFEQRIEERMEIEGCYHDSVRRARTLIGAQGRQGVAGSAEIAQVRLNTIGPTDIVSDGQSRQPIANADGVLASQSPTSLSAEAQIKLPTMPLPQFGGSCAGWPGFYDAFRAAVHENAAAAEKIESLETTAANYSVAWGILEKNYDDPKAIINSRIQAFFELPHCVRANTQSFSDLVDQVTKHYRALEALRTPFLEAFPIYAITSRLDEQSRLRWKEETQGSALPTMEQLLGFLHNRQKLANQASTLAHAVTAVWCQICKERHFTTACPKLNNAQVEQRMEMVRRAKLCTKCLRPNHFARHCAAGGCRQCKGNHHTLLHPSQAMEQQTAVQANVSTLYVSVRPETLLTTAVIHVLDSRGQPRPVRVLLDSGSQSHFLTEAVAKKLGLVRRRIEVPVIGINQTSTGVTSSTTAKIQSRINGFQANINFLIIPHITEKLPSRVIGRTAIKIPGNITLADPNFNTPSKIEGLIDAEWFLRLLCVGQISLENGAVTLQKTKFGWVLGGKLWGSVAAGSSRYNLAREALQQQLGKFWELEETPEKTPVLAEERACEAHFLSNTTRDPVSGRYMVRIPFREGERALGESYSVALKRWYALERRMSKDAGLKEEYLKFLRDYRDLGHMTRIESPASETGYYLPHQTVVKPSSRTTKFRVVFDASSRTSTGVSLNDTMLVGPTIQDDLYSLLVWFRSHSYVLTADIEKMYRQVLMHPADRVYQKILWRSEPWKPLETYALNTLTYGTAATSFLATRTLRQLANDEGDELVRAARVLREDFYMDDLLTGAQAREEAVAIRDELIELCRRGGFHIRQWVANHEALIEGLKDKACDKHFRIDLGEKVKTLGLCWNPKHDTISYSVEDIQPAKRVTKRAMLSRIATLFDPLGLLGPIIIRAKILMQDLWKLKTDWDESVPMDIHSRWVAYCQELNLLREVSIARQVTSKGYVSLQLHGFCDASVQAYGACIYLRVTEQNGNHSTSLVASKSRVAPLKTITLPRLELCAARLLIKLFKSTRGALRRLEFEKVIFWSDSTIALCWIATPPHALKTFVLRRVADIQAISEAHEWRHVRSSDNPADMISRGLAAKEFIRNEQWQQGPAWLKQPETQWPKLELEKKEIPELRPLVVLVSKVSDWDTLERFASYDKLKRVIAHCLRFIHNASHKERHSGALSVTELRGAERCIIQRMQGQSYSDKLHALKTSARVTGRLAPLSPFVDANGLLPVGGRLSRSRLPYGAKHPIILPERHKVTENIVRDHHVKHFHAGAQATLYATRQRFWVPGGKGLVRRIVRSCITCYRAKPPTPTYQMSDLPSARVVQSRPFLRVGVDFCGPILIKEKAHRNRGKVKVYVAIFVCFATKATHIEIVSDLTTQAFLAALRRFFSRRGRPADIYSDNATNFVGARREVKELFAFIKSQARNEAIAVELASENASWHLIPPRAPHFGGLWEAAVRATKHHLVRVIGETLLSYEALLTYVIQIVAILNSRPITALSPDPNDLQALTPAHFLIGGTLTSIPDYDYSGIPLGRLSSWAHIQQMRRHFWNRWSKEYLQEQTIRKKWHSGMAQNIRVGSLVIVREDHTPPLTWPLGRIVAIHPGKDGVTRVVTVKTAYGEYKRCVKRIAPLPLDS